VKRPKNLAFGGTGEIEVSGHILVPKLCLGTQISRPSSVWTPLLRDLWRIMINVGANLVFALNALDRGERPKPGPLPPATLEEKPPLPSGERAGVRGELFGGTGFPACAISPF